jgi:hypothetical protein
MKLCSALKKDGTPCHGPAARVDQEGRCVFHSSLIFPAIKKSHEVTAEELATTLGREIRRLRKLKDPSPQQLQRADAIRNLIILWREMSTPQIEPPPKPLTFAEKVKAFEEEKAGKK